MSEADSTSRRRPPTIDLTAKEVETASPDPKPQPAADAATDATEPASGERAARSSPRVAPYAIGLLAGAIGVAAVGAALWYADIIPAHDASAPPAGQSAAAPPHADGPASAPPTPATQSLQAAGTDQISARLDRIEQALQGPPHTDAALAGRVAGAEAQAKALGDSVAALTRRVDDLAATAQTALAQAKSAAAAADAAKDTAKDATKTAATPGAQGGVQRSDIEGVEGRVAALQNAMKSLNADVVQRASSSNADDRVMRLAIAAEALRAAVERGAPFAAELAAVKALGADPKAAAQLEPFAAQGLTSTAELGRELAALTPALHRAMEPVSGNNTSLLAMLESRAQSLVQITPAGTSAPPVGNDTATVIGRLNAYAAHGDIDAALAEIAKLPDEARAPAKAWVEKAGARQAALAQSRRIAAEALTALAKPESR